MTPDTDSGGFDPKQSRLENPSGWVSLTRYETVRLLVDTLLEAPPGHQFNKSELERRSGVSREAIREHLPFLVELGIVKEVDTDGWAEYRLNDDGKVTKELFELNSAVNSVLGGEPKDIKEEHRVQLPEPDDEMEESIREPVGSVNDVDNSRQDTSDDDMVNQPPSIAGALNAD